MERILVTRIGGLDIDEGLQGKTGPVHATLEFKEFTHAHLLYNYAAKDKDAPTFVSWLKKQSVATNPQLESYYALLTSLQDFGEIYQAADKLLATIQKTNPKAKITLQITPAMQAVWILLGKTKFQVELLQSSKEQGVEKIHIPFDISAELQTSQKLKDLAQASVPTHAVLIVPGGVLFGSSKAHQQLRKDLIENKQLEGIVSLPSGVFKSYAGLSSAILFFTKSGETDSVWLYDLQADGLALDDKCTELRTTPKEQKRIRRKRQLADDFLRSVFLDMLGGPKDSLAVQEMLDQEILLLLKDGNHGSNYSRKEAFAEQGVPFISAKGISESGGEINYSGIAYLEEERAKKLTIGRLKKGDVLLSHNATVGRVDFSEGPASKALIGTSLIGTSLTAYRPNLEKISSGYLFAVFKYSNFQDKLKQNMGRSTRNQAPITAQKEVRVPVGDWGMQNAFEKLYKQIFEYKFRMNSGSVSKAELFDSLSQKAFSGQL